MRIRSEDRVLFRRSPRKPPKQGDGENVFLKARRGSPVLTSDRLFGEIVEAVNKTFQQHLMWGDLANAVKQVPWNGDGMILLPQDSGSVSCPLLVDRIEGCQVETRIVPLLWGPEGQQDQALRIYLRQCSLQRFPVRDCGIVVKVSLSFPPIRAWFGSDPGGRKRLPAHRICVRS